MRIDFGKVLITGAAGMVGSYFDFGIKTDRRSLDVTDFDQTLLFVKSHKPQAIIHLAVETDVDKCEREPRNAYLVNSAGAYHLALVSKKIGAKLVYISTAGVFDGEKDGPYTEEDSPNPQNYYGHSKYLGELAVTNLLDNYIIARACWMFGGGPGRDRKFVSKIIGQLNNPEIAAVNDVYGSPTFGKDLAAAIKEFLMRDATGIYHLSNGGIATRYEVAKKIIEVFNSSVRIVPVASDHFISDAKRAKNESLVSRLNIMRPWQEALEDYLETEWKPVVGLRNEA